MRLSTLALLAVLPVTAAAQAPATPQRYTQIVSVNPFLLPFGWFSGEYERAPNPAYTVGVGAAYVSGGAFEDADDDDARDVWAEAKARYFPNERAPRGFSVGLTAGVHSARGTDGSAFGGRVSGPSTDTAPTVGVIADYDWLLGRRQRFAVGVGLGFKRVLTDVSDSPLLQVYPDGRVQIGLAF